jgi:hypothetical protein
MINEDLGCEIWCAYEIDEDFGIINNDDSYSQSVNFPISLICDEFLIKVEKDMFKFSNNISEGFSLKMNKIFISKKIIEFNKFLKELGKKKVFLFDLTNIFF